jgi:magnesium-transporting ATPase (P-type)
MLQTLRLRSPEDVERSQRHFGLNSKLRPQIKSFLTIFWSQLKNVMLVIFFLFAFVQTAMGMFYADFERGVVEGSSIFLAVFIVILGSSIA